LNHLTMRKAPVRWFVADLPDNQPIARVAGPKQQTWLQACRFPLSGARTSLRPLSIPQEFEPTLYRRGRSFQGGGDQVLRPIHSRHFQKPALFLFSPWPPQLYHASSR